MKLITNKQTIISLVVIVVVAFLIGIGNVLAFTRQHSPNRHAYHTLSTAQTSETLTFDQAILSYEVSLRIMKQYENDNSIDEAGQLVIETEWENVTEEHKSIVYLRNFYDTNEQEVNDGTNTYTQTHHDLRPEGCNSIFSYRCPDRYAKRKQYVYSRLDLLDTLHDTIDDLHDNLAANYAAEAPAETPAQPLPTVPTFDPSQCEFGVDPDDLTECADAPTN